MRTSDDMTYTKHIEAWPTGGVHVEVRAEDGRCCGMELFNNPFNSLESRFKKAHRWADKTIKTLEEYEE